MKTTVTKKSKRTDSTEKGFYQVLDHYFENDMPQGGGYVEALGFAAQLLDLILSWCWSKVLQYFPVKNGRRAYSLPDTTWKCTMSR